MVVGYTRGWVAVK